jgi:SAM-dependent methyltransferase
MPLASLNYFGAHPNHQNAIDLFKGEWTTRLPDSTGWIASRGPARLCEDSRVTWAARELGGFSGKRILELGPLEGGHAYMFEQLNAEEITSIEANARAYLKCLVLKEAFGLARVRFLLGDFNAYLRRTAVRFDVGFVSGVLHHQRNPVELIRLLAQCCETVFVWTLYFDPLYFESQPEAEAGFEELLRASIGGFSHTLYRRSASNVRNRKNDGGGAADGACWMIQSEILAAFEYFGFTIGSSTTEASPSGRALQFVAKNRKRSGL